MSTKNKKDVKIKSPGIKDLPPDVVVLEMHDRLKVVTSDMKIAVSLINGFDRRLKIMEERMRQAQMI